MEISQARVQRHNENFERVLAKENARKAILNQHVKTKIHKTNLFKTYKDAVHVDSKLFATKARAERESIRDQGRRFDEMADYANKRAWLSQPSKRVHVYQQ